MKRHALHRRYATPATYAVIILVAATVLYGCADMPIIDPPPGEGAPIGNASIILGPYLTSEEGKPIKFRFVTNRRCVAGLQLAGNRNRVERQGSFSLFHSLEVPGLTEAPQRYKLWLDDINGGEYTIRNLPRPGRQAVVAFMGGRAEPERLASVGAVLRTPPTPSATVVLTSPFNDNPPQRPEDWATDFFRPLGRATDFGPLWFIPGANAGLPSQLFPEAVAAAGYWRHDVGPLRLIGIDARVFANPKSRQGIIARLDRDLDPSHRSRAWTVVAISRPVFDARTIDGSVVEALGDRLERGGVDLVISGGAPYYMRTKPFTANGSEAQTRYIAIADSPSGLPAGMEPREYVNITSNLPHVTRLVIDEGSLELLVTALNGTPIDSLRLDSSRAPMEPALAKSEIMGDAQAALTLQKETLRIARQAARAVPYPNQPFLLPLRFANPSTKPFTGTMRWEVPPNSRWNIDPPVMPFALQPGQGAVARFALSPAGGDANPILTVEANDVGSAREALIIAPEKRRTVRYSSAPVRMDGRFRDEPYWNEAESISDFVLRDTGSAPARPIEARISADNLGLLIAVSMAAEEAYTAAPKAADPERDRDGPVLDDESLEIFIDPGRTGRDYYQFALNVRNVPYDASSKDGVAYNPRWQRSVKFGRMMEKFQTWDAEIRIPWEAVGLAGPPAEGSEWGIDIIRNDYSALRTAARKGGKQKDAVKPETVQWAPTFGSNQRSGLYGTIVFSGAPATPPEAPGGAGRPSGGSEPLPPVPEPPIPML